MFTVFQPHQNLLMFSLLVLVICFEFSLLKPLKGNKNINKFDVDIIETAAVFGRNVRENIVLYRFSERWSARIPFARWKCLTFFGPNSCDVHVNRWWGDSTSVRANVLLVEKTTKDPLF